MTKRSVIVYSMVIGLVSLSLGCGTGDKGPVSRVTPQDLVSAGSDDNQGGPAGGGVGGSGGGGGTGACVMRVTGTNVCYGNLTNSSCQQVASGFGANPAWTNGATCQSLGYTFCSQAGGYTVCMQ